MDLSKRDLAGILAASAALALPAQAKDGGSEPESQEVTFKTWATINAAEQGYADCLDRYDIAGLVALFTPDGVYDYSPGLVMSGRDAIGEGARKALANVAKSCHFVGTPVVTAGDESASFKSVVYFCATHEHKDGGHHTVYGRYVDIFKPDASGKLLIAHRQTISQLAEGISSARYWLPRSPS